MMSRYLQIVALVCLIQSYSGDHISDKGKSFFLKMSDTSECHALFSCYDCTTARVCRPEEGGKWVEVAKVPCPKELPYCQSATGTCSTTPEPDCGSLDVFVCPKRNGYYPDAMNTTVYHVCEDYLAKKFVCANGLLYDPLAQDCESHTFGRSPVSCGSDGRKIPLPGYPTFFAYCSAGLPVLVDRCIGNYELNVTSQACEATCHGDGVLQDFEDCTKFYLCQTLYITRTEVVTLKTRMNCPKGEGFNPDLHMCGPITNIDRCYGPEA